MPTFPALFKLMMNCVVGIDLKDQGAFKSIPPVQLINCLGVGSKVAAVGSQSQEPPLYQHHEQMILLAWTCNLISHFLLSLKTRQQQGTSLNQVLDNTLSLNIF